MILLNVYSCTTKITTQFWTISTHHPKKFADNTHSYPQWQETIDLFSAPMLSCLETLSLSKWNHTLCSPLSLASSIYHDLGMIQVVAYISILFFFVTE